MPNQNNDIGSNHLIDVLGLLAGGGLAKGAGMALAKSAPTALGILKLVPREGAAHVFNEPRAGPAYFNRYDMFNEGAGKVGFTDTYYTPHDKNLHVSNMESHVPSPFEKGSLPHNQNNGAWSLGPENMKSVLDELMRLNPEAETGSAYRISGARNNPNNKLGGLENVMSDNLVQRNLKRDFSGRE